MVCCRLVLVLLSSTVLAACVATRSFPPVVPAIHNFSGSSNGDFRILSHVRVVVDAAHASAQDDNELSLIPPTLSSFAHTFAADVKELFPGTHVIVTLAEIVDFKPRIGDIILTIRSNGSQPGSDFSLANGSPTSEGYEMEVSSSTVTISGSGAKGAFWGTRTLLQGLTLANGSFPGGIIKDQPDWRTRGFMLDVGRQWYPISFLIELCTYASWFKMSEFHVHLSDNVSPAGNFNAYARFRLRSKFSGLTPHVNETYSQSEFEDFQHQCASRGVTVIPELESPGHALVISQWKPELALPTNPSLLNLSVPETIPTVKSIWQEFLPWIHSKQVSIGADEYLSTLADDYNNFVNTMSDFIGQQANKTIRIWGTKEPSNKTSVSQDITIQHWDFADDDPFSLMHQGYNVINSDDAFQYIVMKQSGSFPGMLNQTRLWEGANVNSGGIWDPHLFDRGNISNNPTIENPRLQGAIMAAWNDHGRNASTFLEAFYALKMGIPVISAHSWQSATRPNHLTHEQFLTGFPTLGLTAPGQNLNRRIPSKGSVVIEYDLSDTTLGSREVRDKSGNGYTGILENDVISTQLGSKGHNYTLLINTTSPLGAGNLLTGPDDTFGFTALGEGTMTLSFNSTNITYPLINYTFPVASSPSSGSGSASWMEIILTGSEGGTSAFVDGVHAGDFLVTITSGVSPIEVPMAFVAPLQNIGLPGGRISRFVVWDGIQDVAAISKFRDVRGK